MFKRMKCPCCKKRMKDVLKKMRQTDEWGKRVIGNTKALDNIGFACTNKRCVLFNRLIVHGEDCGEVYWCVDKPPINLPSIVPY